MALILLGARCLGHAQEPPTSIPAPASAPQTATTGKVAPRSHAAASATMAARRNGPARSGASAPSAVGARADDAAIQKAFANLMTGQPKIDEIRPSPIAGLYEVRFGTTVFYTDAHGDHIVEGQVIDTHTGTNLTQQRLDLLLAIDFATLPFKDAIVWRQGTGERKLAVFADPNCGYCKRFEADMLKVKDVTVYTFLYPILGGDSPDKARDIWCAKDSGQVWRSWMIEGKEPPKSGTACDSAALERNTAYGRVHRINGTPGLLFVDGKRVPGALPADEMEKRLASAATAPHKP